jgi:hypothetical protein
VTDARLHPIYIEAPPYSANSGGVRALHLLCHHLNCLGYKAYVIRGAATNATSGLKTPALSRAVKMLHKLRMRAPIVVYPEVTAGNPRKGKIVVRYLLNKPGLLVPGVEQTYGNGDYFIHYTEEHAIPGRKSFDAFMPLVDRSIYYPDPAEPVRQGFVLYASRVDLDRVTLPAWLTSVTEVSKKNPRSHKELAALYRRSRAVVTFERSTAILEALHCGCPVICIDAEHLREGNAYHRLFQGAGLVWGWDEGRLEAAAAETKTFRDAYGALEQSTSERVNAAFQNIATDFAGRRAAKA